VTAARWGHPSGEIDLAAQAAALLAVVKEATLGEYEIMGELGRGGMGTVYLAHDIAADRKVALKALSPALLFGDAVVERFRQEARTAAALNHPHIVPVYLVRERGDLLYFVMRYVSGRPLDTILHQVGALPVHMAQMILVEMADALAHAHARGIIHRDVKPANILLDESGSALLSDFGIAKVAREQGLTRTGSTVGTPLYMSPEQFTSGTVTGASDQYALGVVAFEMLAGRPPFQLGSALDLGQAHLMTPPPDLLTLRPDCPPRLAEAVMLMLEKDPARRWPTLEALATILRGLRFPGSDQVRDAMSTLARDAERLRRLQLVSTPVSPIPRTRPSMPAVVSAKRPAWGSRSLMSTIRHAIARALGREP
jgi:serine/threonine-protein kinase